ncbi:MAG: alpha/beta hydrolase [Bacteroidales bacterium]|nr:alpha/beta hydrolase [Bacteroidales bacterium]MBQ9309624.1 alpha/beta hydrolase [Bacteroidales bacterium]
MKRILLFANLLCMALCTNSCLAGKYMCNYALKPENHGPADIERTRAKADSLSPGSIAWYDGLKAQGILKDTVITGYNGYPIHAAYLPAEGKAQGTAIVVHGYTDNHYVFLYLVRMYRDEFGFNVFFPDLQYFGYSEGPAAQMGWFDRYDVERWAEVAHGIFRDDFMVIHGVSMGAAATMMMSGDELPPYVRAFVEDCGYSSVWEQFASVLKSSFHLPPFPVLTSANIVCKHRYGWGFKEASSVDQLAKCDRPMLFIHGDSDSFVPFSHLQKNYDAKVLGYKEMWVSEGAVHANSYSRHPKEYTERVRAFLEKARTL